MRVAYQGSGFTDRELIRGGDVAALVYHRMDMGGITSEEAYELLDILWEGSVIVSDEEVADHRS